MLLDPKSSALPLSYKVSPKFMLVIYFMSRVPCLFNKYLVLLKQ